MPDAARRVEPDTWADAVRAAVAEGYARFDWLAAVDEVGRADALRVVVRLSPDDPGADALRLETLVARDGGVLPTLGGLLPGATWHEREARDFFGLTFVGGDDRPLLLSTAFGGRPLRKDAVLGARAVREWPGAKDPGDAQAAGRRRMVPAGVPDPDVWGARVGEPAGPAEVAASVVGGRVRRRT